jgi:hypothetical protein
MRLLVARIAVPLALAFAMIASPASAQSRRAVSVAIHGAQQTGEARLLSATILELLSRLQLTMIEPTAGANNGLLASVVIDLDDTSGAHVVVRSGTGSVVLDRSVHDANPAIQREQIAHAVRGAAEAELLADEERVASSAPASATPPAPSAPPPASPPTETAATPRDDAGEREQSRERTVWSGLALDVSAFVAGGPVASTVGPVLRVGGAAALAYRRGLRPSLSLSALYAFPFEAGDAVLGARTNLVSARALAGLELLRGRWFALEVGVGSGMDVFTVEPTSTVLAASAMGEKTTRFDPILSGAVTMRFAVASDVALTLSVVADGDLVSRRYVFDNRDLSGNVIAPWAVRPFLLAGLSFTAFGEPQFTSSPASSSNRAASARR